MGEANPAHSDPEAERLAALRALDILDTAPEPEFDRLTSLASDMFEVPIALISLVDENRQWFKSKQGLEVCETDRDISFCTHAVAIEETLVVENALSDPRFKKNPLVVGDPCIRFYAGAPLIMPDGQAIGTLCIIDDAPRMFTPYEQERLETLAATVSDLIAVRQYRKDAEKVIEQTQKLAESEVQLRRLGHVLENTKSEVYILDAETLSYRYANRAALDHLEYSLSELQTLTPKVVKPDFEHERFTALAAPLRSGALRFIESESVLRQKSGDTYPVSIRTEYDNSGDRPVYISVVEDLTERKRAEQQRRHQLKLMQQVLDDASTGFYLLNPVHDTNGEIVDLMIEFASPANPMVNTSDVRNGVGKVMSEARPDLDLAATIQAATHVLSTGELFSYDDELNIETGKHWFHVSVYPVADGRLVVAFLPIDELKRTQISLEEQAVRLEETTNALQQQTELMQQVLDKAGPAFLMLSPVFSDRGDLKDLIIEFEAAANPSPTPRPPNDGVGRRISEARPYLNHPRIVAICETALKSPDPVFFEESFTRDGTTHWFHGSAYRVSNNRIVVSVSSIDELKTSQLELEQKTRNLEAMSALNNSILDSSEAGILSLEPVRDAATSEVIDYRFVAANPANAKITGRTPEQLIGNTLLNEFPGNKTDGLFDIYHRVASTGEPAQLEINYDHDSVRDWFNVSAVQTGRDGVTITFQPITELKSQQIAYRTLNEIASSASISDSEASHKLLALGRAAFHCDIGYISLIEDGQCVIDTLAGESEILQQGATCPLSGSGCASPLLSGEAVAFADLKDAPFAGCAGTEGVGCAPSDAFGTYISAPIRVDEQIIGTLTFVDPDPRARGFSELDLDLINLMALQLGARRQMAAYQHSLRANGEQLQFILDNVPSRIWFKDDKNRILRANTPAAQSMGFDVGEDIADTDTYDLFPQMAKKYHDDDLAVINSGEPLRNIVESYMPRDGEQGWVSTDKIPMKAPDGEQRLLVVATDVTDQKRHEEELERLNKSLSDFAYVAAHDLQSPLRQATMFSEILAAEMKADDLKLNKYGQEAFDSMLETIQYMRTIVRSLYDLAALDSEEIEKTPVDLNDVVSRAKTLVQAHLDEARMVIDVDQLETLPGDKDLLVRVIQNLISNACKFSDKESPHLSISGRFDPTALMYELSIQDNGPGIPMEYQERVFEPFKRLHSGKKLTGAGIGLSLCRRIVNLHGGRISIDPAVDDGTRFVVRLPLN